jgi:CDP-diacylglycerol--glycerol-3-phosphate 3-phosphatidyltransferase
MIARDVIVDALRMSAANQNKVIAANIFGKLKTIFQMVALILMFFVFNHNSEGNPLNYYLLQNILMYVALLVSIMSGVIYFIKYSNSANI